MERTPKKQKVEEELSSFHIGKEFRRLCLDPQFPAQRQENEKELLHLAMKILPLHVIGYNIGIHAPIKIDDYEQKKIWIERIYGSNLCDAISRYGTEKGNEFLLASAMRENIPNEIWYLILQTTARENYDAAVNLAATSKNLQSMLHPIIDIENKEREENSEHALIKQVCDAFYMTSIFSYFNDCVEIEELCYLRRMKFIHDENFSMYKVLNFVPLSKFYQVDFMHAGASEIFKCILLPYDIPFETMDNPAYVNLVGDALLKIVMDIQLKYSYKSIYIGPMHLNMSLIVKHERLRIWSILMTLGIVDHEYINGYNAKKTLLLKCKNQLVKDMKLLKPKYFLPKNLIAKDF